MQDKLDILDQMVKTACMVLLVRLGKRDQQETQERQGMKVNPEKEELLERMDDLDLLGIQEKMGILVLYDASIGHCCYTW